MEVWEPSGVTGKNGQTLNRMVVYLVNLSYDKLKDLLNKLVALDEEVRKQNVTDGTWLLLMALKKIKRKT